LTGNLAMPALGDVEIGVTFGANRTEFTRVLAVQLQAIGPMSIRGASVPGRISGSVGVKFSWADDKGTITLLIEGSESGSIDAPSPVRTYALGMSIGRDNLSPVTDDYVAPFPFSGAIRRLEVDMQPFRSPKDKRKEAEIRHRTEMARQ